MVDAFSAGVYAGSLSFSKMASVDGAAHKKPNATRPPTGASRNSCHQALLPVSCSRREPTASRGNKTAIRNMLAAVSLMSVKTEAQRTTNNMNHQNSAREARPLKSAYFEKHLRIASEKVIWVASLSVVESRGMFMVSSLLNLEMASRRDVIQFDKLNWSPFSAEGRLPATVDSPRSSCSSQFGSI